MACSVISGPVHVDAYGWECLTYPNCLMQALIEHMKQSDCSFYSPSSACKRKGKDVVLLWVKTFFFQQLKKKISNSATATQIQSQACFLVLQES